MRLKQLFIFLSLSAILLLSGGVAFIYVDGRSSIEFNEKKESLEAFEDKKVLDFILLYQKFHSSPESNNQIELVASLKGLSFLKLSKQEEFINQTRSLVILNNQKSEIIQKKVQLEKKRDKRRKEFEKILNQEIVKRLQKGRDFMPELGKKLDSWSESLAFLKKVKDGIGVNYLDKQKHNELLQLMSYSEKLVESDFKNLSLREYNFGDNLRIRLEVSVELLKKENQQIDILLKSLATSNKKIASGFQMAENYFRSKILGAWKESRANEQYQLQLERNKRHKLILDIVIGITVFSIVGLLILFLSIFPQLSKLERRAFSLSEGDFQEEFKKIPKNEIGSVMQAFNTMISKIRLYIQQIEEEQRKQEELNHSIQEMQKLNAMGELSAKMSHELKNPIAILNFCLSDARDFIKEGRVDKAEDELRKSEEALERLKLISGKLGVRSVISDKEKIDISLLVEEVFKMYEGKSSVSIKNIPSGPCVFISKIEFQSALCNLIDNALESSGETSIEVELKDRDVMITVSNQGQRLEDESLLFNNFYSTKEGSNRGLGLSIVKEIMMRENGRVDYFYGDEKHHFVLTLPLI